MKKIFITAGIIIFTLLIGLFVIYMYDNDISNNPHNVKVGLMLNGVKNDKSWCQSHYEGLSRTSEQLDLTIDCREYVTTDNIAAVIDELVEGGCEIIVANSFEFGDGVMAAAQKYPGIYFLHASGITSAKNVSSFFGRMYQMRYLTGVAAGLQTKTNEIGYVAAFPISEVNRGINAFTLGVRSVNPEAKVYVRWINSWIGDDIAAGITNRLLNEHDIDVLSMHTDSVKPLEVADKMGVMTVGYHLDNSAEYPDTYLTAAVWDWEKFYTPNITKCIQSKFQGEVYWDDIETGIVSMAPLSPKAENGIAGAVAAAEKQLRSGSFDVFYGPITDNNGVLRAGEGECMTDSALLNEMDWYVEGVVIDE